MNKQTEALKMAIEALERVDRWLQERHMGNLTPLEKDAIQACKEALEQPAQEPYGWLYEECIDDPNHAIGYYYTQAFSWSEVIGGTPVYTHPAPSWQGLTDDEMMKIIEACEDKFDRHLLGGIMISRAIEQALKEKNG